MILSLKHARPWMTALLVAPLLSPMMTLPAPAETQSPTKAQTPDKTPDQAKEEPKPFVCPPLADPVVQLDYGSRYKSKDKSRSAFDKTSNAEVNKQLKPVDSFVNDMITAANAALTASASETGAPEAKIATDCVVAGLAAWAKAGALGDMGTPNASLSVPSRVAGLGYAWAEVKPLVAKSAETDQIEAWLSGLATASMAFFDTDAPGNSAKNNLRAWAALAVARVGVTLQDKTMTDWADASVQLVACQAKPDGSLPLEMARKDLALHYQLHAVTALVSAAALLQTDGHALFAACDGSLHRSVRFVLDAFANPDLTTELSGVKQSYFDGSDKLQGFELAWAPAYLATFYAPDLAGFVAPFGDLANSKLGGQQSLLWGGTQ